MRPLFTSVVVGVASLSLVALAPSQGQAWGPRYYSTAFYYPAQTAPYYAPVMTSFYCPPPRPVVYCPAPVSYAPPAMYGQPPSPLPAYGQPAYSPSPAYAPPTSAPPTGYAAPSRGAAVSVGVYDNYFQPASIQVPPGTTVRWTNYGQHRHTVTASDGRWDSGELGQGGSYSVTFTRPGTYAYYCRIHPKEMRGTVIVGSGGGSGPGGGYGGSGPSGY